MVIPSIRPNCGSFQPRSAGKRKVAGVTPLSLVALKRDFFLRE